jgi:hypothetical protein
MNINRFFATLGLLLGATFCSNAQNYTLQIGNITWVGGPGGYNPFSATAYPNTVNFTITKNVYGSSVTYSVMAGTSATSGNYTRQMASGANRLNYQIYTTSAMTYVLQAPNVATANNAISGTSSATKGTVIPLSFLFYVTPSQVVAAGTYTDTVVVGIYNAFNSTSPMTSKSITITTVVAASAALSIVPTGSAFSTSTSQTFAFGTLATGQVLGCDLLVKRNTSATVTFDSANHGVMKAIPTPDTDQIPYTFVANGTTFNLASAANLLLPAGVSTTGTRLPINVTIGNISAAGAGNYQDQVTITVTAP